MNFPINYDYDKERRKTHPFFLPKIEDSTKGEELKKNIVGGSMKSNKIALEKTQTVDVNGVYKAAYKFLSKQVKTLT